MLKFKDISHRHNSKSGDEENQQAGGKHKELDEKMQTTIDFADDRWEIDLSVNSQITKVVKESRKTSWIDRCGGSSTEDGRCRGQRKFGSGRYHCDTGRRR